MRAAWEPSRFWITGLPRSRTAWFSQAMRGPHSTCFHELTASTATYDEFKRLWLAGEAPRVGNADSACGLQIARILEDVAPRTLIVQRPIGEVIAALADIGIVWNGLRQRLELLDDALTFAHPLIKRVRFKDLADRDALIEAVEWLIPGHGEQAAGLMDLDIQVTNARLVALASARHTLWHLEGAR